MENLSRQNEIIAARDDKHQKFQYESLKAYILFQPRRLTNKISLGCHDGTLEGKKYAVEMQIRP